MVARPITRAAGHPTTRARGAPAEQRQAAWFCEGERERERLESGAVQCLNGIQIKFKVKSTVDSNETKLEVSENFRKSHGDRIGDFEQL